MFRHIATVVLCLVLMTARSVAGEHVVVVELFTSQGCSSCPQADAFLSELAKSPDLLALSEHVDYWDYLGWKDPFATPDNTRRQRDYAGRLGLGYLYTPQMIIHGLRQASGSDRMAVQQRIVEAQTAPSVPLQVDRTQDGGWIARLARATLSERADVWLVRFVQASLTRVSQGENGGRRIENTNVVREFRRLGVWDGEPFSLSIPAPSPTTGEGSAILVQQIDNGRILGAARLQAAAR